MQKIIIINIKYYLNYIIDILNKKRQKCKVGEKRKKLVELKEWWNCKG